MDNQCDSPKEGANNTDRLYLDMVRCNLSLASIPEDEMTWGDLAELEGGSGRFMAFLKSIGIPSVFKLVEACRGKLGHNKVYKIANDPRGASTDDVAVLLGVLTDWAEENDRLDDLSNAWVSLNAPSSPQVLEDALMGAARRHLEDKARSNIVRIANSLDFDGLIALSHVAEGLELRERSQSEEDKLREGIASIQARLYSLKDMYPTEEDPIADLLGCMGFNRHTPPQG